MFSIHEDKNSVFCNYEKQHPFFSMLKISSVKGLNSGAKIMQTCQIYAGQTITKTIFSKQQRTPVLQSDQKYPKPAWTLGTLTPR